MSAHELLCINSHCGTRFPVEQVIYTCPRCGSLLEVSAPAALEVESVKRRWRERRASNAPEDRSGVWRFRELLPFDDMRRIVTLGEGNTALLEAPRAATYAGLDALLFKHQGFNPTGSFKDNGMTAGASQALRLGMKRVACVSTGNTSASMAAYAAAAGLTAVIFLPHGNISFGKLAQAIEYGALTVQVEANFDEILRLVRELAEKTGIYLLNSVNPFRIEGQKTIMAELLDQLDWRVPDWIVLPGGNLGNISAFGKAFRELRALGFIPRLPRFAVVQAKGSAPFYHYFLRRSEFRAVEKPETLATAIRIGDPVSWPKAIEVIDESGGVVTAVSEQEIADAKAVIGRCGIGCEPASAATLAGIRRLAGEGVIRACDFVVAVLTGHVLKDPDYIYRYHTGQLAAPGGEKILANFANQPVTAKADVGELAALLERHAPA